MLCPQIWPSALLSFHFEQHTAACTGYWKIADNRWLKNYYAAYFLWNLTWIILRPVLRVSENKVRRTLFKTRIYSNFPTRLVQLIYIGWWVFEIDYRTMCCSPIWVKLFELIQERSAMSWAEKESRKKPSKTASLNSRKWRPIPLQTQKKLKPYLGLQKYIDAQKFSKWFVQTTKWMQHILNAFGNCTKITKKETVIFTGWK